MTRRDFALAAASTPAISYRTYSRLWPDWMRRLVNDAYTRRKADLARLTTPAAIKQRQAWARTTLWQLIGGEPARTPLNLRTTGSFERPAYRVEKLTFESQPGLIVAANLYVPRLAQPPFPGVLFQMGHALNGKANDGYQRCCQGLAQLGYLVLAFDPMGQGERTYYPRPDGGTLTRLDSADTEHTLPGQQMLLTGDTATRLQLWDAIRSLDVLASHPQVDPNRLASTGQSGGATLTMLLAAADDRLAAAALTCGNTENFACRDFNPPGSSDDAEQNLIASTPAAFDRWDLLYPLAPKPLLIAASARDFFGTYSPNYLTSGREEFAELARVYRTLGRPSALRWSETPLPHGLTQPLRLEIYQWFGQHLQNEPKPVAVEPPTSPEPDETLWTGRSGNTVRDHGSIRPLDLVRARLQMPLSPPDWPKLLGLVNLPPARPAILGRTRFTGVQIEAIEIPSEPPLFLPAWLYRPDSSTNGKLLIVLESAGRAARWQEGQLLHQLAQAGFTVCAADLRGIGDLRPELGRGSLPHALSHQHEDHWAWASLILGRPLLGQRVVDILSLARAFSGHEIHLIAAGRLIAAAVLAAHLEKTIAAVHHYGPIPSFGAIAASEEYTHPVADFVPHLLRHTDLPELASSSRYRRLSAWNLDEIRRLLTLR